MNLFGWPFKTFIIHKMLVGRKKNPNRFYWESLISHLEHLLSDFGFWGTAITGALLFSADTSRELFSFYLKKNLPKLKNWQEGKAASKKFLGQYNICEKQGNIYFSTSTRVLYHLSILNNNSSSLSPSSPASLISSSWHPNSLLSLWSEVGIPIHMVIQPQTIAWLGTPSLLPTSNPLRILP